MAADEKINDGLTLGLRTDAPPGGGIAPPGVQRIGRRSTVSVHDRGRDGSAAKYGQHLDMSVQKTIVGKLNNTW